MKALLSLALIVGVAANAALFAWQIRAEPKTTTTISTRIPPVVTRVPGGLLELSTVQTEERFDSTTNHTILGVPTGTTVAQIRVPAVYRYHVPLAKDWTVRLSGKALLVIAPPVEPSLPVAINTAKLESFSSGLWSPITGAAAVAQLQKSITETLRRKASTPDMLNLQRETARRTLTEFVQKWVASQPEWKDKKVPTLLVFFEDELLGQRATPLITDQ